VRPAIPSRIDSVMAHILMTHILMTHV